MYNQGSLEKQNQQVLCVSAHVCDHSVGWQAQDPRNQWDSSSLKASVKTPRKDNSADEFWRLSTG